MRPDIARRTPAGPDSAGFDRFSLRPELLQAVRDAGYTAPRPIQEQALPPALEGRDVLGLAQTGTGKTAAFVLPILQRLLDARSRDPRVLVVVPTRELAAQVHAEFESLAAHTPITSACVFGGVPIARNQRALRARPDVVVACPGRLLDLLGQGMLRLDAVEVLVLDEADHMFDMGFLPDVRRILRALPAKRQNLMFSATMPPEIRKLADTVLRRPAVVELAHSRPAETIAHALYPLGEKEKVGALESLLSGDDFRTAIVFLRTKRRAKQLAARLDERGHSAVALQGNMSQPQRERALAGFRDGSFDVLVATDIAARGLDIAGVSHVVNYDVPNTPDAYTHRIGRTGRAEATGKAYTFVTDDDTAAVRAIERRLGKPIERRRLSELGPLESETLRGSRSARPARGGRGSKGPAGKPARKTRSTRPARPTRARLVSVPAAPPAAPVVDDGPAFGAGVVESSRAQRSAAPGRPEPAETQERGRRRRRRRRTA